MTKNASVSIHCTDLLTLEAMLERIHTAARAGHLDWDGCTINADIDFRASLEQQSFKPLEDVIDKQNRPHGVTCSIVIKEDAA
jgi:hypothetical protein